MNTEKPIKLQRNCDAVMVPSGEPAALLAGSTVWLTQALGGTYTVMTDRGYSVRIDGQDGDALGFAPGAAENWPQARAELPTGSIDELVWNELRSCFDPEIPVNIVDLGLIYDCAAQPLPERRIQSHRPFHVDGAGLRHGTVSQGRHQEEIARRAWRARSRCRVGVGSAMESEHDFRARQTAVGH